MSSPDRPQGKENFVSRVEFEKMVDKVRQCEADKLKVMKDQGNLMKEFNKRMQVHLEEIRLLKDVNQKLQADLQELRDLTCYLDDDRQKCRKLAREWQRFGRYTASVMRNEVANYQDKLKVLEEKQIDLSKDNAELKELCLYLDRQRESIALDNRTFCSNCSQRVTSAEDLSSSIQQNTIGIKRLVFCVYSGWIWDYKLYFHSLSLIDVQRFVSFFVHSSIWRFWECIRSRSIQVSSV